MKKTVMTIALALLAGGVSSWAQSSGSTHNNNGSQTSSAIRKDTNSQLRGRGVPYTKEKEQFGKRISKKKKGTVPAPSVSSGHNVSDTAQKGITPGSHVTQRDTKAGRKTTSQKESTSKKKDNQ